MRIKKLSKWAQRLENKIIKKTSRLDFRIETDLVTPDSAPEFNDYGVVISGEVNKCNFYSFIPFRPERVVMRFDIPIGINWTAQYENRGGAYRTKGKGKWVSRPKNRKRSRQINKKFPKPIVGYFNGGSFVSIDVGGYLAPTEGEASELVIDSLCPRRKEARVVWNALKRIGDVVSVMTEWK
jgi:hypothetical protein